MTSEFDYAALMERAVADLKHKTEEAIDRYRLDECHWDVDLNNGTITFTHESGKKARAPMQVIGTYDPGDQTWLWAWDHPSIQPPLNNHAKNLRVYGEEHGITELTQRKIQCGEDDCWRFTALASFLNKAHGAYRGPTDGPLIFMTYGPVTMAQPRT